MNYQIRKDLDFILHELYNARDPSRVTTELYSKFAPVKFEDKRWGLLTAILENDGLITWKTSTPNSFIFLTPKGKKFLTLSGYLQEGQKELWQKSWLIIKTVAVALHSALLLWLTYLTYLK